MRILAVAQVEDRTNLDKQVLQQTVQPFRTVFLQDTNAGKTIEERRIRIAENHKKLRDIVKAYDCDYVWQLEQDGDYPPDTLERLINDLNRVDVDKLAYISGIEYGRHGVACLGAWHMKLNDDRFYSEDFRNIGLQEVDATGFYCLLAPKNVWLQGKATWNGEPYGPDVSFGLSLKAKGYKIYVDHDIEIGHKITVGNREIIITETTTTPCNIEFTKDAAGKWKYKLEY